MLDFNIQMRDAYISRMYELAKKDKNIIFISNEQGAMSLDKFRSELPDQFINAGISEQNIISMAAGLCHSGKRVIVYSIATFITLRCFEQIKIDLCVMKLPVTIVGVGTCYSYSTDGPTHHASEDVSIMRSLDNMEIYNPSDSVTAYKLADYSIQTTLPTYIRFDREKMPIINSLNQEIDEGLTILSEGNDYCLISTGNMVHTAMKVSEKLKKDSINVKVIDVFKLKPINSQKLFLELEGCRAIFTIEEHTINGGLGSIISELIHDNELNIKLKRFAIRDGNLYNYAERHLLHEYNEIDVDSLYSQIVTYIN
jgi:transketolase